jgi:zinc protease
MAIFTYHGIKPMNFLSALLATTLLFGATEFPPADQLLQLSLERSGGAQALAKAKNAVMSGTVDMQGHNISGPVSLYQDTSRSYMVIDIPGIGKIEEGFDGETAWEMNALQGARIKDGEEKAAAERASKLSLLSSWRDDYKEGKTVGTENVAGKPAWKVEMTPKDGKPEYFYFDKDTMLLVRTTATIATPLGEIPVDAVMSDYRSVDGIKTPFTLTQTAMGQVLVMHFDKVQYNAAIPAGRFDPPPAVKALAARRKEPVR